jgi:hypothetical protein
MNTENPFNEAFTSYFHRSVGGYHGAKLRRYQDIIDRYLSKFDIDVLNMLNTKYFIVADRDTGKRYAELNPDANGAAWMVDDVVFVDGAAAELSALETIDNKRQAVVDKRFREAVRVSGTGSASLAESGKNSAGTAGNAGSAERETADSERESVENEANSAGASAGNRAGAGAKNRAEAGGNAGSAGRETADSEWESIENESNSAGASTGNRAGAGAKNRAEAGGNASSAGRETANSERESVENEANSAGAGAAHSTGTGTGAAAGDATGAAAGDVAEVELTVYQPNYQRYETLSATEKVAVFSEIYYDKGWTAYLDGKPTAYFRADYILRAMVVPAGAHSIEWRFRAPHFAKVEGVTLVCSIAILLWLAAGCIFFVRKRQLKKQ